MPTTPITSCTAVQPIKVCNQRNTDDFKLALESLRLAYSNQTPTTSSEQKSANIPNVRCSTCQKNYIYNLHEVCFGLLPNTELATRNTFAYSLHIIHVSLEAIAPYIHILNAQAHKLLPSEPAELLTELAEAYTTSHPTSIHKQHTASRFTIEDLDLSQLQSIQNIIGIFLCGKVREELRGSRQYIDIDRTLHQKNLKPVKLLLHSLQSTIQDRLILSSKTNSQLTSSTNSRSLTPNSPISEAIDYHPEETPYPQSFQPECSYSEEDEWQIMLPGILSDELHSHHSSSDLPDIFVDTTAPHPLSSGSSTDVFNPNFGQIHSPQTESSSTTATLNQILAKNISGALLLDSVPPSLNSSFQPTSSHSQAIIMICPDGQPQYILSNKIRSSDLHVYINSKLPTISCKVKTISSILHKPYITLHTSEVGEVKVGNPKSEPDAKPRLGFAHIHEDVYQKVCSIHNGKQHPFTYTKNMFTTFDSSIKFPDPITFERENAELLASYIYYNNDYCTIASIKEQLLIFLGTTIIDQALDILKLQESEKLSTTALYRKLLYTSLIARLNIRHTIPFIINTIDIALAQYNSQAIAWNLGSGATIETLKPIEQREPLPPRDITSNYLLKRENIEQITSPENDFTIELPEQITSETIKTFLQKTENLSPPPPNILYVPCVVFHPLPEGTVLYTVPSNNYRCKKTYMIVVRIHSQDIVDWNTISASFTALESIQTSKMQAAKQVVKNALTFFCPHLKDIDTSALEDAIKNISLDDRKAAQQRYYFQFGIKIATKIFRKAVNALNQGHLFTFDSQTKLSANIRDKNFQKKIDISDDIDIQDMIKRYKDNSNAAIYFQNFFSTWSLPEPLPKRKYKVKALPGDDLPPLKIQKTHK